MSTKKPLNFKRAADRAAGDQAQAPTPAMPAPGPAPATQPRQLDIEDVTGRRAATPPPASSAKHAFQWKCPAEDWPDVVASADQYAAKGSINTFVTDAVRYYMAALESGYRPRR